MLSTWLSPEFLYLVEKDMKSQEFFVVWWWEEPFTKIFSFCNNKFWTLPNWKSVQMTILNLIKLTENSPKRWKTMWEKKKLLITSNFSFSHSVFERPALQTHKSKGLLGKGLITMKYKPLDNIWKSRKCLWSPFFTFPVMISTLCKNFGSFYPFQIGCL